MDASSQRTIRVTPLDSPSQALPGRTPAPATDLPLVPPDAPPPPSDPALAPQNLDASTPSSSGSATRPLDDSPTPPPLRLELPLADSSTSSASYTTAAGDGEASSPASSTMTARWSFACLDDAGRMQLHEWWRSADFDGYPSSSLVDMTDSVMSSGPTSTLAPLGANSSARRNSPNSYVPGGTSCARTGPAAPQLPSAARVPNLRLRSPFLKTGHASRSTADCVALAGPGSPPTRSPLLRCRSYTPSSTSQRLFKPLDACTGLAAIATPLSPLGSFHRDVSIGGGSPPGGSLLEDFEKRCTPRPSPSASPETIVHGETSGAGEAPLVPSAALREDVPACDPGIPGSVPAGLQSTYLDPEGLLSDGSDTDTGDAPAAPSTPAPEAPIPPAPSPDSAPLLQQQSVVTALAAVDGLSIRPRASLDLAAPGHAVSAETPVMVRDSSADDGGAAAAPSTPESLARGPSGVRFASQPTSVLLPVTSSLNSVSDARSDDGIAVSGSPSEAVSSSEGYVSQAASTEARDQEVRRAPATPIGSPQEASFSRRAHQQQSMEGAADGQTSGEATVDAHSAPFSPSPRSRAPDAVDGISAGPALCDQDAAEASDDGARAHATAFKSPDAYAPVPRSAAHTAHSKGGSQSKVSVFDAPTVCEPARRTQSPIHARSSMQPVAPGSPRRGSTRLARIFSSARRSSALEAPPRGPRGNAGEDTTGDLATSTSLQKRSSLPRQASLAAGRVRSVAQRGWRSLREVLSTSQKRRAGPGASGKRRGTAAGSPSRRHGGDGAAAVSAPLPSPKSEFFKTLASNINSIDPETSDRLTRASMRRDASLGCVASPYASRSRAASGGRDSAHSSIYESAAAHSPTYAASAADTRSSDWHVGLQMTLNRGSSSPRRGHCASPSSRLASHDGSLDASVRASATPWPQQQAGRASSADMADFGLHRHSHAPLPLQKVQEASPHELEACRSLPGTPSVSQGAFSRGVASVAPPPPPPKPLPEKPSPKHPHALRVKAAAHGKHHHPHTPKRLRALFCAAPSPVNS